MLRFIDITNVVIKYQLDEYLFRSKQTKILSLASGSIRSVFGVKRVSGTLGYRIRCALEELGPVFVKFGQILSTRPDIVPSSIIRELQHLKESVKPFDGEVAKAGVEYELGLLSIHDVFKEFDTVPVASGSVAQVHLGVLHNGDEVAVKILRPDIEETIKKDIALFRQVASMVEMYKPVTKQLNIQKIIDELSISIMGELDLRQEAESIEKFKNNLAEFDYVHVPRVYREYSTSAILVMERMSGTPIDQDDLLRSQGVDIEKLVLQGLELLMVQIFRDGFFHADQHSGNLWIKPDGSRVYLDFGIMGTLSADDRKLLLRVLFHMYSKNYKKLLTAIVDGGWTSADTDFETLELEMTRLGSMFVNKEQQDFSLGKVFNNFVTSLQKFGVKVPYQYTLLGKTIITIEGLSKQIAPNLNIGKASGPILLKHFSKMKS
jgi:ubiquinone biosynthesis protein